MSRDATVDEVNTAVEINKNTLALVDVRNDAQKKVPAKIENAVNIPDLAAALKLDDGEFESTYRLEFDENNA